MTRHRFYFLEPSKVGTQHLLLLEGFLRALSSSAAIADGWDLVLLASKRTLALIPDSVSSAFLCRAVPVMNPEKRRLMLKSCLESAVVVRSMLRLRPGDVLFVSCLLPTSLLIVESINRVLRKSGIYVVLHGEIEGLFKPTQQSVLSIGYWSARWLKHRRVDSRIRLVVLDDFIAEALVSTYPEKLSSANVSVVHLPVVPAQLPERAELVATRACFIGFRTRDKSYASFINLAQMSPDLTFVAIGGGTVEEMSTGMVEPLESEDAYLREIGKCSVALLPYTSGYTASLSASAMDALSAGVPLVTLDRPCFRSLASSLGVEMVHVCSSIEEMCSELVGRAFSAEEEEARARRLERVARSKYGPTSVQGSFERLVDATDR